MQLQKPVGNLVQMKPMDDSQRKAALVIGALYILVNITGTFSEFYARGTLITDSAAVTAHNILVNQLLFRISILGDLITFSCDVILAAAFYILLKRIDRGVTMAGVFFRIVDAAILAGMLLMSFVALKLLSGVDYLHPFSTEQQQALARVFISAHGSAYFLGLLFYSISTLCTSYVLFKSGYVPKMLAGWGVFAAALLLVLDLAIIIYPAVADAAFPAGFLPSLSFEILAGIWLIVRGMQRVPHAREHSAVNETQDAS